jgi:heme-degrading monooxygenase HmoA
VVARVYFFPESYEYAVAPAATGEKSMITPNDLQKSRYRSGSSALSSFLLWLAGPAAGCISQSDTGTITVRPGADVVTAIERFTVDESDHSADNDAEHSQQTVTTLPIAGGNSPVTPELERAWSYTENTLRRTPGFVAALVLNGQHGEVAVYSQWDADGKTPLAVLPKWSVAPALVGSRARLVDARTYKVDFSAPDESTQFTTATTAHAHFGVFTMEPDAQEHLLELARSNAPSSIGTPGLIAINFHRSLDGGQVVNLGAWTDFEGFAKLLARPGFMDGAPYWEGVAGFQNIFFDVAAVIAAP